MASSADWIHRLTEILEQVLPGQAPIKDFVHHNTLHGFQSLPFPEAVASAARLTGTRGYLPEAYFREFLTQGRIDRSDLVAVLQQQMGDDLLTTLVEGVYLSTATDGVGEKVPLRRLDVLLASFVTSLEPLTHRQLRWRATELGVLKTQPELWQTCLDVLGFTWKEIESSQPSIQEKPLLPSWPELIDRLGKDWTLRGLLLFLTGEDLFNYLRPTLIRHLAAHLDQGLAPWSNPARCKGFYAAWRESAYTDLIWSLAGLLYPGTTGPLYQWITTLPNTAIETIHVELTRLGLPEERWIGYLERLALELPGWSGMFLWRHHHPNYDHSTVPVDMEDYLAVRLVLERIYADALCRRHWGVEARLSLLENVSFEVPPVVSPPLSPACSRVWPLFSLAQHLGLDAATLRGMGQSGAERMLAILGELDEQQRGYLWLNAYERHYRESIFATLAANHGRGKWAQREVSPQTQLVFCMDDREEGLRRHLEEGNPHIETLGAAAHFNVPHRWRGIDASEAVALAPVIPTPVIPVHEVCERARSEDEGQHHAKRHALRRRAVRGLHRGTRRGLLTPALLSAVAALPASVALMAQTLIPARWDRWLRRMANTFDTLVTTTINLTVTTNDHPPPTPDFPSLGFTDIEQVDRVRSFLLGNGLTYGFAPLVAVIGHASHSLNNPHVSAYNCGACAGRYSGPNARVVAAMANRPSVRGLLAAEGIVIPNGTWFLGAEHDTCDESITWSDVEDLPPNHRPAFDALCIEMAAACREHARERCRRFVSASFELSPKQALHHVIGRAADFSQVRPELGHATNACAFIGRRAMSRGAFFDRRAFLISYDPTQDGDGTVLERHLLTNGAVGAGINLEYYFSTVDNDRHGCGSKVMHNIAGLLGVMDGANSDLRTGLPRQMIEIHEAMRLLVVIEQKTEVITTLYQRQPALQELVGNAWVIIAAKDPDSPAIHLFDPKQGWQLWQGSRDVPRVKRSIDWFLNHREARPPVLLG